MARSASSENSPTMKSIIILWPHVWTSEGKAMCDAALSLPKEEADALIASGAAKAKRGSKKDAE